MNLNFYPSCFEIIRFEKSLHIVNCVIKFSKTTKNHMLSFIRFKGEKRAKVEFFLHNAVVPADNIWSLQICAFLLYFISKLKWFHSSHTLNHDEVLHFRNYCFKLYLHTGSKKIWTIYCFALQNTDIFLYTYLSYKSKS